MAAQYVGSFPMKKAMLEISTLPTHVWAFGLSTTGALEERQNLLRPAVDEVM